MSAVLFSMGGVTGGGVGLVVPADTGGVDVAVVVAVVVAVEDAERVVVDAVSLFRRRRRLIMFNVSSSLVFSFSAGPAAPFFASMLSCLLLLSPVWARAGVATAKREKNMKDAAMSMREVRDMNGALLARPS